MLNAQWGLMVWTLITFALAAVILWKYAFGPLQRIIDERRAQIRESLETAEETRDEAARLLAEYQETLASVRTEAEEILGRSRKAGESTRAEIVEGARRQAERTLEKAHEQIDRDVRAALKELKAQVADLTLLATERVARTSLSAADQKRLIDEALADIEFDELEAKGAE
jgi:F-type H+-transporting ATPase subunit b